MRMLTITSAEIERLYTPLQSIGCLAETPAGGYFRPAWSVEESQAIEYVATEGRRIGLEARTDALGNMYLERAGREAGFVETGSHLDTVSFGGNYDGAAGIIAGLAAIRSLLSSLPNPRFGVRLRIWRGEESATYGTLCKGSQAAFGYLAPATLEKHFEGKTLCQAIIDAGFDPAPIKQTLPTISQVEIDNIIAHLELHIEQARSLERNGIDIGTVTGIRAPHRLRIELNGSFDHSGATPMGVKYRRDTNLALGYILVALDRLQQDATAKGYDLVQTVGVINSDADINETDLRVYQNAVAKVSGFCYFTIDIRSNDEAFRSAYVRSVEEKIVKKARSFGVDARVSLISVSKPQASLDENLRRVVEESSALLGYSYKPLLSGAVHDAVFVAQAKKSDGTSPPTGMIFIPCKDGISHSPEEFASYEAIAKGASVLATTFLNLMKS